MVDEILEFYSELFTSEDTLGWEDKLDCVPSTITYFINSRLIRLVEGSEIIKAFFLDQNKAPRMDDMIPLFFQSFWNIIHEDICNTVKSFFKQAFC